jgi:hypothetical protein
MEYTMADLKDKFYPVEIRKTHGGYTSFPVLVTDDGDVEIKSGEVYDVSFQDVSISCVAELNDLGNNEEASVVLQGHFVSLDGNGFIFKAVKGTMARINQRLTAIQQLQQKKGKEQERKDQIEKAIISLIKERKQAEQAISELEKQLDQLENAK